MLNSGSSSSYDGSLDYAAVFDSSMFENLDSGSSDTVETFDEKSILGEYQDLAQKTSVLLNVTTSAACRVLVHYKWNFEKTTDDYFSKADQLLEQLGLQRGNQPFRRLQVTEKNSRTCPLCLEEYPNESNISEQGVVFLELTACKHTVCESCWINLLTASVQDGKDCVILTCPVDCPLSENRFVRCKTLIDETMFQQLLPTELYAKYQKFVVRSFVDSNPFVRWCPRPECDRLIRCTKRDALNVQCSCGFHCCFRCKEEAHFPATCEQMVNWKVRIHGEGDNLAYVKANARPCPRCKTPVIRNEGCNHMTCRECKLRGDPPDWCWVCGEIYDQKTHKSFFVCPNAEKSEVLQRRQDAAAQGSDLQSFVKRCDQYIEHDRIRRLQSSKEHMARVEQHCKKMDVYNPGVDSSYVKTSVEALVEARTYLQFSNVVLFGLPDHTKGLVEGKMQLAEKSVAELSNVLEGLYRWSSLRLDEMKNIGPPYPRDEVTKQTWLLKDRMKDLMDTVKLL